MSLPRSIASCWGAALRPAGRYSARTTIKGLGIVIMLAEMSLYKRLSLMAPRPVVRRKREQSESRTLWPIMQQVTALAESAESCWAMVFQGRRSDRLTQGVFASCHRGHLRWLALTWPPLEVSLRATNPFVTIIEQFWRWSGLARRGFWCCCIKRRSRAPHNLWHHLRINDGKNVRFPAPNDGELEIRHRQLSVNKIQFG